MQISLSNRGLTQFDAASLSSPEDRHVLYSIGRLDVSYNSFTMVRGMQFLSNLTSLDVSHNRLSSLEGLPLTLRRLNASFNDLRSMQGLSPLLQLEWLEVSHNEITSVDGIPHTNALRYLDFVDNRISDITALSAAPCAHEIRLARNLLRRAEDLLPLSGIKSLRTLYIEGNPVAKSGECCTALQEFLPKTCSIIGMPPPQPHSVRQERMKATHVGSSSFAVIHAPTVQASSSCLNMSQVSSIPQEGSVARERNETQSVQDLRKSVSESIRHRTNMVADFRRATLTAAKERAPSRGSCDVEQLVIPSAPSIELNRRLQRQVEKLNGEVELLRCQLKEKIEQCDTQALLIKQLRGTVDRTAKVNATLIESNTNKSDIRMVENSKMVDSRTAAMGRSSNKEASRHIR